MMVLEYLPGYDEWKTTDPRDYEPEERPEPDPDREREEAQEREDLDRQFESLED